MTLLLSLLLSTAHAGKLPEATWFASDLAATDLCLSSVPHAGKVRGKDAKVVQEAMDLLASGEGIAEGWPAVDAALGELKPHPAVDALRATGAWMTGGDGEPLVELSSAWPYDACLGTTAAAWALLDGRTADAEAIAGRAWIAGPSGPLGALLATAVIELGDLERAFTIANRALQVAPEDGAVRRIRARAAVMLGDPDRVADDLDWLLDQGDTTLDPYLMPVYFTQGKVDAYLKLAARQGLPVAIAPGLAEAESPLATLRAAMGLERPGDRLVATLVTSEGEIPCTLFVDRAPVTVANFVGLATGKQPWTDPRTGTAGEGPLYVDIPFHRVIPGFMVQTGDPQGDGRGGPGYRFPDEIVRSLHFDRLGRLAMANAGPDTNGSQFFVTDGEAFHLDGKHTIFGQCTSPDVATRIANVDRDTNDRPYQTVTLERVDLTVVPAR